jgi:hypothetical protein
MGVPNEYRYASREFDRYLDALRARTLIDSRNVWYGDRRRVPRLPQPAFGG